MSENETLSENETFTIAGSNADFKSRSSDVFACLGSLEAKHKAHNSAQPPVLVEEDTPEESHPINTDCVTSISFKKPVGKPAKPKRVPDFVQHPEKWTKYDLSDVPDSSDGANRGAAMKFMDELKKGKMTDKDTTMDVDKDDSPTKKHVFMKRTLKKTDPDTTKTDETKDSDSSSVVEKTGSIKKSLLPGIVQLGHLDDGDLDEEGDTVSEKVAQETDSSSKKHKLPSSVSFCPKKKKTLSIRSRTDADSDEEKD